MSIPYRTQQNLKRLAGTLLILLVVALIFGALWFVWLQRYVVYTREDGAVINFDLPEKLQQGVTAMEPEIAETIELYYNEGENKMEVSSDLMKLNGYYVTGSTLARNPDAVLEQIMALPAGTPVMVELKNVYGMFYYSTATGRPTSDEADVRGVDNLIRKLKDSGYYTIARVPALRDRAYGLEDPNEGLAVPAGYLWMDGDGCYWLDPTRDKIQSYLMDICTELRILGFDEVVFDEFRFPNTDGIVFSGDRNATLESVAQTLVDTCSTEIFAVSFISNGSWKEPEGRSRVYRQDISDAIKLMEFNNSVTVEEPQTRVVLLTNNMDESFEEYSVLRPIDLAIGEE